MTNTADIQGVKSSFYHIVFEQYFNDNAKVKECLTFDDLVHRKCDTGVMTIENSIAKSIMKIMANDFKILGSIKMQSYDRTSK